MRFFTINKLVRYGVADANFLVQSVENLKQITFFHTQVFVVTYN